MATGTWNSIADSQRTMGDGEGRHLADQPRSLASASNVDICCLPCSKVLSKLDEASQCIFDTTKRCERCVRLHYRCDAVSSAIGLGSPFGIDSSQVPEQFWDEVGLLLAKKKVIEHQDSDEKGESATFIADTKSYVKRLGSFPRAYDQRRRLTRAPRRCPAPSLDAPVPHDTGLSADDRATSPVIVPNTTQGWRETISLVVALRLRRVLLALLLISPVVFLVSRITRMLLSNRYASDQTLLNQAGQLYAVHASLPLLYAHLLTTVTFPTMFALAHEGAYLTEGAVRREYSSCPMTPEQSSQLLPPLVLLAESTRRLENLVEGELHQRLVMLAEEGFRSRIPRPLELLDQAIRDTRNRSHRQEILICAHDLFPLLDGLGWPKDAGGINSYGLQPLEGYSVSLDKEVDEVLLFLGKALHLLLDVHDRYNNVFTTLGDIGLSRCREALEKELSQGRQHPWVVENDEEREPSGWIARLFKRPAGEEPRPLVLVGLTPSRYSSGLSTFN